MDNPDRSVEAWADLILNREEPKPQVFVITKLYANEIEFHMVCTDEKMAATLYHELDEEYGGMDQYHIQIEQCELIEGTP